MVGGAMKARTLLKPPGSPHQLRHPIVLVHGLGARSYGPFDYFHGLRKSLEAAGNVVFTARLSSWHTIEFRAQQLREQIEAAFPDSKVNILAHSMGGLDSRFLISRLGFSERIASLTTIGTPHRGTTISDIALGLVPETALGAADRVLTFLNINARSEAFLQLTRRYSTEVLHSALPDDPRVGYFSATSAIPAASLTRSSLPIFWASHGLMMKHEGDNDGFVSVESAKWGTHICTYKGDHYAQIGQIMGYSRGLDYLAFYEEILTRLRSEGF